MTESQSLMLAVCCGISVGWLVGQYIGLAIFGIGEWCRKRREKKSNKPQ